MTETMFTDEEKLAAAEHEVVRRKRMFRLSPAPHKTSQIEVMKAIASDYRERIATQERTDGLRSGDEGPDRAIEG